MDTAAAAWRLELRPQTLVSDRTRTLAAGGRCHRSGCEVAMREAVIVDLVSARMRADLR